MTAPQCQAQTRAGTQCSRQAWGFMHDADESIYAWCMFWTCTLHRLHPPLRFLGVRVRSDDVPEDWQVHWAWALEQRQVALDDRLIAAQKQVNWARQELERARAVVTTPP